MKSIKRLWGMFALVALASSVLWLAGCSNQDAELAEQQKKELETVRAELETARSAVAAQETEMARLRKDNLELLKLRNEVNQLRSQNQTITKQVQAAQTQAQQAQAQIQAAQSQAQQAAQALAQQQQALAAQSQGNPQQQANTCINQLRQIDGAMQQWALENKKDANAVPAPKDIEPYLRGGLPKCPAGGAYALGAVSTPPRCSIPGHALP